MMKKIALLPLAALAVAVVLGGEIRASEQAEAAALEAYTEYSEHFFQGNYPKAAELMDPRDLEATREALLPVFLEAAKSPREDVRIYTDSFFNGVSPESRAQMSSTEVYVAFLNLVFPEGSDVRKVFESADLNVLRVDLQGDDKAEVHYEMIFEGRSVSKSVKMAKSSGTWYTRVNDDPKQIAQRFRELFGLTP
ncbi:MAG: hypothetical protein AAFN78_01800 [Pseudomonadota bacterium]